MSYPLFSFVKDLSDGFGLAVDGYKVIAVLENPFMEVVRDA